MRYAKGDIVWYVLAFFCNSFIRNVSKFHTYEILRCSWVSSTFTSTTWIFTFPLPCSMAAVKRLPVLVIGTVIISYFGCVCAWYLLSWVWPPWNCYFRQGLCIVTLMPMFWIAALQHYTFWQIIWHCSFRQHRWGAFSVRMSGASFLYSVVRNICQCHTNSHAALWFSGTFTSVTLILNILRFKSVLNVP